MRIYLDDSDSKIRKVRKCRPTVSNETIPATKLKFFFTKEVHVQSITDIVLLWLILLPRMFISSYTTIYFFVKNFHFWMFIFQWIRRKKLYPTPNMKYLGVKIDENLNWHHHINDLAAKLNRANALLFKIKNYVNQKVLRSTYFAIFDWHFNYANLIWAPNLNAIRQTIILQKKLSE